MIEEAPPAPAKPPVHRLIRAKEVVARLSISKAQLYFMIKDGRFPPPVEISPAWKAWPEAVVDDWIAAHVSKAAALN